MGVAGYLAKRGAVKPGSREWGRAFEHFILMELHARATYSEHAPKRSILVAAVPKPRRTDDGIQILPWQVFLDRLAAGEILR